MSRALRVAIFGGPGSGAIVVQSIHALQARGNDIEIAGFLNDVLPEGTSVVGFPILGPFSSWTRLSADTVFLAPLHRVKVMEARFKIVMALGIPDGRWATIVDPMSAVAPDAVIGPGSFVGPFATVGPGTRLGKHTVARAGAHVSHDCRIGDFVFVGTNAVICGATNVEEGAYVAPSATVSDNLHVGRFATVGLGAVVASNVPDSATVVGVPARPQG